MPFCRLADRLIRNDAPSFRPETLTCRPGQNASTCLTHEQIFALHRIYAPYYEANQSYVFGGYYPGGETEFYKGLVGQTQFKIGKAYFQFMVTKWELIQTLPSRMSHIDQYLQRYELDHS